MQEMVFFFYGTLMDSKIGEVLERTPAFIRGQLWDLGPFPAAREGEGVIKGMIVRVEVPEGFLHAMDYYEGFYGEGNPHNYYERKLVAATNVDGNEIECWAYFFVDERDFQRPKKKLIESGDWFGRFKNVDFKGGSDAGEA